MGGDFVSKRLGALGLVVVLVVAVLGACSPKEPTTPPLLPSGFETAPVPDIDLSGYVYVNSGKTIQAKGDLVGLSGDFDVRSLALWGLPGGDGAALRIEFASPSQAQQTSDKVNKDAKLKSILNGNVLYVLYGPPGSTEGLSAVISAGKWVKFQDRFPDPWKTMNRLPDKPPFAPVGVGFVSLDPTLINKVIVGSGATGLGDLTKSLQTAQIDLVAFGLYSKENLSASKDFRAKDALKSGQAVVAVAKSSIPSIAVSVAFNKIVTDIGFQKSSGKAGGYSKQLDNYEVMIMNRGNVIHSALAPNSGDANDLLESVTNR